MYLCRIESIRKTEKLVPDVNKKGKQRKRENDVTGILKNDNERR